MYILYISVGHSVNDKKSADGGAQNYAILQYITNIDRFLIPYNAIQKSIPLTAYLF